MAMLDCLNICGPTESFTDRESTDRGASFTNAPPPPSIFDDAATMICAALSVYVFADLRELARDSKTGISLEDFTPPMTLVEVMQSIETNKEALKESMSPAAYEEMEEMSRTMVQLHSIKNGGIMNAILGKSEESLLVEFVDIEAQKRLVHAITLNRSLKRITIAFRGSATKNDFITDSKIAQIKVDNPVHVLDKRLPTTINIHSGFQGYLFAKNTETGKTRIEEILDSTKNLLRENPGYQLYCTGHSLGGALSSLFGFHAAADEEIAQLTTGPVRIFSVASPYVGNQKFLLAFQALERVKRLQHLRIANAEDVVTHMPFVAPKLGLVSPIMALAQGGAVNLYKHCGIKLHLNSSTGDDSKPLYQLSYTQDQSTDEQYAMQITAAFEEGKNFWNSFKQAVFNKDTETVAKYHSCTEYEFRLKACKKDLENKTLDDLYNDNDIIGNVLDPEYEPKVMFSATERVGRVARSDLLKSTMSIGLSLGKKEVTNTDVTNGGKEEVTNTDATKSRSDTLKSSISTKFGFSFGKKKLTNTEVTTTA
eukprot:CAMPEP_0198256354 /NCGR_PEP_ID=MMETSP1447-20131203/6289_1 /TAXON_ID=420782 /ORGANISM="Chaetoceros dichaeta, Strain CCMP1751" /LENGTH=538 /DNA_ID=CAMNT_0043942983 /DNA_START=79 /DNA_END=1695 /DNA_ORIENTATION=+